MKCAPFLYKMYFPPSPHWQRGARWWPYWSSVSRSSLTAVCAPLSILSTAPVSPINQDGVAKQNGRWLLIQFVSTPTDRQCWGRILFLKIPFLKSKRSRLKRQMVENTGFFLKTSSLIVSAGFGYRAFLEAKGTPPRCEGVQSSCWLGPATCRRGPPASPHRPPFGGKILPVVE